MRSSCKYVCLSVRSHISQKSCPNFTKFSVYMLTAAVARSSSDDNAIRYVFPSRFGMTTCYGADRDTGQLCHFNWFGELFTARQVAPRVKFALVGCLVYKKVVSGRSRSLKRELLNRAYVSY